VLDYHYNEILRSWNKNENDIAAQAKLPLSRLGWRFKVFWSNGNIKLKARSHKKKCWRSDNGLAWLFKPTIINCIFGKIGT